MPQKLKASLVMLNVPSENPTQTRTFYSQLLGIELIPTLEEQESFHAPISEDGIDLMTGPRRHPQEQAVAYFHVDNLDDALNQVQGAGGDVVWGPSDITMSDVEFDAYSEEYKREERGGPPPKKQMTRAAVVREPGGGQVGLLQVEEHMHGHFKVGKHQKPISDQQLSHMKAGKQAANKVDQARGRR